MAGLAESGPEVENLNLQLPIHAPFSSIMQPGDGGGGEQGGQREEENNPIHSSSLIPPKYVRLHVHNTHLHTT